MLVQECQKSTEVMKSATDDGGGAVDDTHRTPCPGCEVFAEQLSPLLVGNPQSLSDATKAKCSVAATKYKGLLLRLLLGITLVTLGLGIWLLDPVELYIRKMLSFHEGSFLFENWKNPPIPITHKIYVFNVTNADGFLHNGEKLRVEEVGPYSYSETLKNKVLRFNDNGTISYTPRRTMAFSKELSERNAIDDIVVVPNIALIAFISIMHNAPLYLRWPAQQLVTRLNLEPFISITVDDLLMGYEDPLVTMGNTFLSKIIPISKLGVLDLIQRPNDTITMYTNPDDPSRTDPKIYSMALMNGSPGLDYWGYGETLVETENGTLVPELLNCNAARGTYEGVLLPRYIPENETLMIFRKYFCRPLPAVFNKDVTEYGLKLRQYKLKEDAFDRNNPDNWCYCEGNKRGCLPSGLADVTPCYFNVPAATSNPHFLYGDKSLVEAIDGISPDAEKHDSYFSVLTSIGPYPEHLMILMRLAVNIGPIMQTVLKVLFLISGSILVLMVISQHFFPIKQMKNKLNVVRVQNK